MLAYNAWRFWCITTYGSITLARLVGWLQVVIDCRLPTSAGPCTLTCGDLIEFFPDGRSLRVHELRWSIRKFCGTIMFRNLPLVQQPLLALCHRISCYPVHVWHILPKDFRWLVTQAQVGHPERTKENFSLTANILLRPHHLTYSARVTLLTQCVRTTCRAILSRLGPWKDVYAMWE